MTRRTELEIATEILNLCSIPQGKTKIVYDCNMNFNTVKPYLDKLINMNPPMLQVVKVDNRIYYETTDKGKEYIFDAIKAIETLRLLVVE